VLPPESFAGAVWIDGAGIAVAVAVLGYGYMRRRKLAVGRLGEA
jgi:hypothetical protein